MDQFVTEVFVLQQDWLWFLATLGLLGALAAGLRSSPDRKGEAWAAWIVGGQLAVALAELVRIAQMVRPEQMGPPNLEIDLLHGIILAMQAWGVWWTTKRSLPWLLAMVGFMLLAWLRLPYPWPVTLALSVVVTAGVWWHGRRAEDATGRNLAWIVLPGVWLSPIGPATCALNSWIIERWSKAVVEAAPREYEMTVFTAALRRWGTTGPWGTWAALILLATGILCMWQLTRRRWSEGERRELRRFIPLMLLWLAAGLALAVGMGARTKREFETAQKQRVNLAAKLLVATDLETAFGPVFNPQREAPGRGQGMATVSREFQKAVVPVRRQLSLIQTELPDDCFAYVLVERNGLKLAGAVADIFAMRSNRMIILKPEPDFAGKLETKYVPPFQEVHSLVAQARAPLHFRDGRFLGWLVIEFGPGEWLAAQTQVRLQALAIVGLGFGLALMGLRQRLRSLARDEALREAEAARQADRIKTEFLARVSHELRTPIQSVLGYGELLQTAVRGDEAKARLGALRQHGLLMLRLVNDLLDLGALQTGRFHLSPKPTQVVELVRQTVESMRPRAEAKGLAYHLRTTGTSDDWRLVDGERLRQVVINLVANAIKFTDRGAIDVFLEHSDAHELVLRVSDTGPGISSGNAVRLFQPFARLENTASKEGTGLGLVLAKGLSENMGGGITLESQSTGACFVARFRLPRIPALQPAERPVVGSLRGHAILVVDDNTLIRELFSAYLQELGADCTVAPDGPAALQLAAARPYDVVVLDLALPGMSGTDVARVLRLHGAPDLRIIGVSAHASAEDRGQALAAGMNAFLTKPVDLRVLVDEIEQRQSPSSGLRLSAGLQERLQAQFRTEAPVLATALAVALEQEDWPMVRAKAHYLKNSADVLGLRGLATSCQALEIAIGLRHHPDIVASAESCQFHLRNWC